MSTAPTLARYTLRAMEKIAPLRLAEKWDNVGLLLESPVARPEANRVLLTIDLTPSVLEEALHPSTALVISYHPPIFKPLSSITLANSLQTSILKLAAVGVSVYSPHTALDSVRGGINDFLASGLVNIEASVPAGTVHEIERAGEVKFLGGVTKEEDEGGLGRLVELHRETPIEVVVERIKGHLGLNYVDLARPLVPRQVRTIAVCAGSGGSVLASVNADVFFTGEMSHHEVLAAIAAGRYVVLCGHTNTERGYLPVLASKLRALLAEYAQPMSAMTPMSGHDGGAQGLSLTEAERRALRSAKVYVSQTDRHPLERV
ncbi:NGG1p interacting factor 3 [Pisolithus thermaeus]|nr:NGG1p interacting factor 3 [Pisolithus thermaeus]